MRKSNSYVLAGAARWWDSECKDAFGSVFVLAHQKFGAVGWFEIGGSERREPKHGRVDGDGNGAVGEETDEETGPFVQRRPPGPHATRRGRRSCADWDRIANEQHLC